MGEEEKNPNPSSIYISNDLMEEIFVRLPLKSILKLKILSKEWRSNLESRRFTERRRSVKKKQKILAACKCNNKGESRLEEAEEEMVYVHSDNTQFSMTCEGLVCIPEPDWINVFNPSTRQYQRFPSGPAPVSPFDNRHLGKPWATYFPGGKAMGFGRDKVTGCFKVVRMCFDPVEECDVLDVNVGIGTSGHQWRKLTPSSHKIDVFRKSVCVNGSIYWFQIWPCSMILTLNLHTEKFHTVRFPETWLTWDTELLNLEDRLALAKTLGAPEWELEIWIMDAHEESWSQTHTLNLAASLTINPLEANLFTPLSVSKLGDVVFFDNHKRLFKYYLETNEIRCLSSDICVISPYTENLVSLKSYSGHHSIRTSSCTSSGFGISTFFKRVNFGYLATVFILRFLYSRNFFNRFF